MAKKTSLVDARRPTGGSRPRSMEELIQAVQTETSVPPKLSIFCLSRDYGVATTSLGTRA